MGNDADDDDEAFAEKVNARFQSFRKGEATAAGECVHLRSTYHPLRSCSRSFFFVFLPVGTVFFFFFLFCPQSTDMRC